MGHTNDNAGSDGTGKTPQRQDQRQRLQALEQQNEDYLRTIKIQTIVMTYLRLYANAGDADRKDIEIQYLTALLAEYGCVEPERLGGPQERAEG